MRAQTKAEWRRFVLEERRGADAELRATENRALVRHVITTVQPGTTVCAYVPTHLEPGTTALLDAVYAVAERVLLPLTGETSEPGPLRWAVYTGVGDLVPAAHGLREPAGPALEPAALSTADTVFVPALAVDRRGVRLGRGAGYYDRSLRLARPDARIVTIVRDSELIDELPEDPHDVRMGWAITPSTGLRRLPE